MHNPFTLEGKVVVVTGASSGIGRGIAIACANMGAKVIAIGRNLERLEETKKMMGSDNHEAIACDLTKNDEVEKTVESFPIIDGIVHCAGVGQRILCKELDEADLDYVMNTNFKGPVLLQSRLLKKKKVKRGASIVFVASIASSSPSIGNSVYSASKGALISYANCLGLELAPRLIRVNCISPAMIRTELIYKEGLSEEQLKADEQKYPLKRYGTPEDIANLAVYLLSDASCWMTGSNIKIAGGIN